ncbi:ATP-dependent RNA helicase [Phytophthora megakarya]|uniref:RNA helicase n=1 Tax=Phytophthora megakarya TaxID=4795 RepID=A0A225WZV7_9STRA|nr:ATP-dependent RNA helicase [Phytophthora megakarya]
MEQSTGDHGFEFRRDLEQLVHDGVLSSRRRLQRSRFRPGVSASSAPADVQLQQRTKRKLARVLQTLREDYGASLALSKEALAYTNSLEDALSFLALQHSSDELPASLRAQPTELLSVTGAEEGALQAEVEVSTGQEKNNTEALSWTQQYVLHMAAREEELARQKAQVTPEARELEELEKRYHDLVAAVTRMKERKSKKKTKSGDKQKTRELNEQMQDTRRQLLAQFDDGGDGGLFGLLQEAEATVVSAEEIKKSAAIDTASLIAAQAAAEIAASKGKKGKGGKNKKGRNMLKVQAAAQAAQAQAAAATAWTGKSPRDHLEEHCRKNGFQKPQYKKLPRPAGGGHLYSVALSNKTRGKFDINVRDASDVAQGFNSISDAKDAVATSALFELASDLPLYRVLSPQYRDMWQLWIKKQQENEAAAAAADRDEQDELLTEIFSTLPSEIAMKRAVLEVLTSKTSAPVVKDSKATEQVLDDWSVDDWDADLSDDENITTKESNVSSNDNVKARVDDLQVEEESESDRNSALELSRQLREQLQRLMRSGAYRSKLQQRENLPIASFKKQVVEMLSNHDVILISGETGCGKSTQVPQFLLEDLLFSEPGGARGQIVCTQPRRLAAISLAERVSEELGESNMGTGDSLTGFQIRLETRMTRRTRLLFCTTGILLRKLQDPCTLGEEVSHVIVDEVHERDLQSDVLLAMLRQFLAEGNAARRRKFGGTLPPLKVILMSATLNAASFQQYFGGSSVCPMIEVPGRTFPVEQFYLEDVLEKTQFVVDEESPAYISEDESGSKRDSTQITISGRGGTSHTQQISWTSSSAVSSSKTPSEAQRMLAEKYTEPTLLALERIDPSVVNYELIQALLEHIITETDLLSLSKGDKRKSASVLVFLPGLQEITTLLDVLGGSRLLRHDQRGREFELLPLHSSLSAQEQQRIFRQRSGVIRIIAATNIAETSLTIDDVKVVIDTGRVKQMSHDTQRRTNVLDEIWVARANAKQRAGRAGRTSGGSCFRLFPQSVFSSVMLEQPVPEIRRAPLTSLCLQIKTFGVSGEQKDGCGEFLRACLDPPDDGSICDALEELFEIGALDRENEALTKLGGHLARLPVDVKVGKLLLLGALFGVFDAASTCAAILETKSPFVAPFGRQSEMKQARQNFAVGASDLLTDVNAFEAWRYVVHNGKNGGISEKSFCSQNFLSHRGLRELSKLKRQFRGLVVQLGFLPQAESAGDERMTLQQLATISAILYAGLAPNLVHAEPPSAFGPKRAVLRERDHSIVLMHPSSINYKVTTFRASNFLTYAVKLHTSQVYLPASSLVLPLAVCLFSHALELLPQLRRKDKDGNETIGLRVNEWVVFHTSYRSAALIQEMRDVVLECINSSLQTPPFSRGVNAESKTQKTERQSLIDVLRVLFVAEYEERDPNKQLSGHMCAGKQRD